ncbi:MAG: N-acetylmuramoyl-L-alanine amidase [Thermoanaerobaculia bacterium]|nr:N-acetylmuramoyl-L-alanine amidase [Thermoanaerobaculia bacterium]
MTLSPDTPGPPPGRGIDPRLKRRLLSGAVDENVRAIQNLPRHKLYRKPPVGRWLLFALAGLGTLAAASWAIWFRPAAPATSPPSTLAAGLAPAPLPQLPPLAPYATLRGPASPMEPGAATAGAQAMGPLDPDLLADFGTDTVPTRLAARLFPVAVRRIVLDPGHGGGDEGTRTPVGLTEKFLTLDIAQRLAQFLAAAGFEVRMTRDTDSKLFLRDRVRFANQAHADLFVSIHVNWLKDGRADRGIETYYLGPSDDPFITELASAENRESGYSMADVRQLLDGIYSDLRQQESRRLAAAVQRRLVGAVREVSREVRDRGVRSAPFLVLVETEMPAILAEVASLASPEEARLLAQPEYRDRLARALFDGIRAYSLATEQLAGR